MRYSNRISNYIIKSAHHQHMKKYLNILHIYCKSLESYCYVVCEAIISIWFCNYYSETMVVDMEMCSFVVHSGFSSDCSSNQFYISHSSRGYIVTTDFPGNSRLINRGYLFIWTIFRFMWNTKHRLSIIGVVRGRLVNRIS